MNVLKKYQLITFLNDFREKGCNTIDDIINLLNKELENIDDVVYSWEESGDLDGENQESI